jgi:hypothetical protein
METTRYFDQELGPGNSLYLPKTANLGRLGQNPGLWPRNLSLTLMSWFGKDIPLGVD